MNLPVLAMLYRAIPLSTGYLRQNIVLANGSVISDMFVCLFGPYMFNKKF